MLQTGARVTIIGRSEAKTQEAAAETGARAEVQHAARSHHGPPVGQARLLPHHRVVTEHLHDDRSLRQQRELLGRPRPELGAVLPAGRPP